MTDQQRIVEAIRSILDGTSTKMTYGHFVIEKGFGHEVRLSFPAARLLLEELTSATGQIAVKSTRE